MKDFINMVKERLEEIKNNPGALFGLLYPYLLVIIIIVGLYYVSNLEFIARQKVPPYVSQAVVETDLPVQQARTVPPIKISDYAKPNTDLLTEGEKLYKANCSSCHGENGAGGGPAAMGLNPAPKNFTDNQNWKNGSTLSGIYTTLEEGIAGGAMAAYDYLLPVEKISLAHFIRENFVTDKPMDSESDLQALDLTYNLSAGQQLPAQIPVASATAILLKENLFITNKVNTAFQKIVTDNSAGALVFRTVSYSISKSLSFLVKNNGWKKSERNFVEFVTMSINHSGFKPSVLRLGNDEWSFMYSYLNSIL